MFHAGNGQRGVGDKDKIARAELPNPFASPLGFCVLLLVVLPWRVAGSQQRMMLWMCGFPIQNNNHSLANYAQVQQDPPEQSIYADLVCCASVAPQLLLFTSCDCILYIYI